jgi:hypothetical protein
LVTGEQFSGDIGELVGALACRAHVFAQLEGESLKLEEIQILCRVQDEAKILGALKPSTKLCTACFNDKPRTQTRK